MKIAYLSSHFSGKIKLDYLIRKGVTPDSIVTIDAELGRSARVAGRHDYSLDARSIPIHHVSDFGLNHDDDRSYFENERFDVILISGWQRLIPRKVLETLSIGAIGEHGSSEYLPRGRGRSPINWTLIAGRRRFVNHLFLADAGADSGPVIDWESLPINEHDTIASVYAKVALSSGKLFLRNFAAIESGDWTPVQQADIEASEYPRRHEADDWIDWESSAATVHDKIRAITRPYPGARARIGDRVAVLWSAQPFDSPLDDFAEENGALLQTLPDDSLLIKVQDGQILVTDYDWID